MGLQKEEKKLLIEKFGKTSLDTGSIEVQVALLTKRFEKLNAHFKIHQKDHASRRGLLKLVGKRRKLLKYLHRTNPQAYATLIQTAGIRGIV